MKDPLFNLINLIICEISEEQRIASKIFYKLSKLVYKWSESLFNWCKLIEIQSELSPIEIPKEAKWKQIFLMIHMWKQSEFLVDANESDFLRDPLW